MRIPKGFTTLEEFDKKLFKDPAFKKAYDALEVEFAVVEMMLDYRIKYDLTQAELAKRVGMKQSTIARFERGPGNPTIKFLKRIADGLGMDLVIKLRART